ncbi:hypothetical protein [Kalamiella sp. sgz302252]|uniref:hypothetical protein n=1 Tax=Pantoea sp. sgz302252 TaxID=3341827 RepID=UPI0036D2C56B
MSAGIFPSDHLTLLQEDNPLSVAEGFHYDNADNRPDRRFLRYENKTRAPPGTQGDRSLSLLAAVTALPALCIGHSSPNA